MKGNEPPNRERLYTVALLAGVALLWIALRPVNYAEAEDVLAYVWDAGHASWRWSFHPNHLLFLPLARLWYGVWALLGWSGGPLLPMQTLSMGAGLLTLGLIVRFARKHGVSARQANTVAALYAGTFGFWMYACQPDVYILPLPLLLLALSGAERMERPRYALLAGMAWGLAILLHQSNVLFGLALLPLCRRRPDRRRGAALGLGAAAGVTLLAYALVIALAWRPQTPAAALTMLQGHAARGAWGFWEWSAPLKAVAGAGRALIGAHFVFAIPPLDAAAQNLFPYKLLQEERYLVAEWSVARAWAMLALAAAVGGGMLGLAVRALREWRKPAADRDALRVALLCWFGAYALFFLWWEPANLEFWIATLLPLFLLLALTPGDGLPRWAPAVAAGLLIVNGLSSIAPQADVQRDYWRVWAKPLAQTMDENQTLAVIAGEYLSRTYLRHLGIERMFPVGGFKSTDRLMEDLRERIKGEHIRRLAISDSLVNYHPGSARFGGWKPEVLHQAFESLRPPGPPTAENGLHRVWVRDLTQHPLSDIRSAPEADDEPQ